MDLCGLIWKEPHRFVVERKVVSSKQYLQDLYMHTPQYFLFSFKTSLKGYHFKHTRKFGE